MYILEPLYLSSHHSHRRVPHQFKCIISQKNWIILIGCRTDGDLKAGGWLFLIVLVILSQPHNPKTLYKLRRTWYKMDKIARIKSAHLQPDHHFLTRHVWHSPDTPDTTDTSDSDTYTPFLPDTVVSSFSGSGIGWLTIDAYRPAMSSIDFWLISEWRSWETETRFYGRASME